MYNYQILINNESVGGIFGGGGTEINLPAEITPESIFIVYEPNKFNIRLINLLYLSRISQIIGS